MDPGRANRVKATVSAEALKLMTTGTPSKQAVAVVKSAAVKIASARRIV